MARCHSNTRCGRRRLHLYLDERSGRVPLRASTVVNFFLIAGPVFGRYRGHSLSWPELFGLEGRQGDGIVGGSSVERNTQIGADTTSGRINNCRQTTATISSKIATAGSTSPPRAL